MKKTPLYLSLFLFCFVPLAHAQHSNSQQGPGPYNFALGFGTVQDTATGEGISSFDLTGCTPSPTSTICEATPGLHSLFMGFDGDAMLNKRFGFGGELNFQPGKGNYGPIQYRQEFYDFNALFEPYSNKHVTFRLEGGIGGAHTGFSITESSCIGVAVCSNQSASVGSANHFQEHASVGVQVYLTRNFFVRPQFDFRNVSNFTNQFGKDTVLQGGIWLGYNFGTF